MQSGAYGAVATAQRDFELECRLRTLKLADGLVDALSGEARNRWLIWVDEFRKTIRVTVAESELAFFRLPR